MLQNINPLTAALSTATSVAGNMEKGLNFGESLASSIPVFGGILNNKFTQDKLDRMRIRQAEQAENAYAKNSQSNMAQWDISGKGNSFTMAKGGTLRPISDVALEVIGNDPKKTDGVRLFDTGGVRVDNKEMIKDGKVFSDDLGYAEKAKNLEKMKSSSPRFKQYNNLIDKATNRIFEIQENSKRMYDSKGYAEGGELNPQEEVTKSNIRAEQQYILDLMKQSPSAFSRTKNEVEMARRSIHDMITKTSHTTNPYTFESAAQDMLLKKLLIEDPSLTKGNNTPQVLYSKGGKLGGYAEGGEPWWKTKGWSAPPIEPNISGLQSKGLMNPNTPTGNLEIQAPPVQTNLGSGPTLPSEDFSLENLLTKDNIQTGLKALGTFGPNVAEMFRKPPKPPALARQPEARFERVNFADQLEETERQYLLGRKAIEENTAQSGNVNTNLGKLMADKAYAKNRIRGEESRANAQIANQEELVNTRVRGANTQIENQDRFNRFERRMANFVRKGQNVADIGNKIQAWMAEENMKSLDQETMKLILARFPDVKGLEGHLKTLLEK